MEEALRVNRDKRPMLKPTGSDDAAKTYWNQSENRPEPELLRQNEDSYPPGAVAVRCSSPEGSVPHGCSLWRVRADGQSADGTTWLRATQIAAQGRRRVNRSQNTGLKESNPLPCSANTFLPSKGKHSGEETDC
ncbi:hypothetical protein EYF80_023940 [Liparis tanakae]|uniref:Uncharacterized protein n=1 Tax=Liparis tanakae TaxID=230148 RepID=A0A4Z2HJ05_9TELE|nr:hypothetical protein EYF80_023940 [Liparis tanakae]